MSTYSTNLALELIGTGEQAGTWGNTTNTNLGTLIEQAISGYVTQAVATGTDTTLTIPNGATGVARNMYIELTGTGGTNTNLIVPSNKKLYFIYNNSTGAVTVKVSGQTGVSVAATEKKILVSNGTDIVEATSYITAINSSLTLTTLNATSANITTLSGTAVNYGSATISTGNLTFSSTGQRITGDFSNATLSNRLAFQTSTTNGNTIVGAFPNGTGSNARLQLFSASDPANASTASMEANATSSLVIINADKTGTGTYLPLTFYTGGSERMRLDTSGNLGIGTTPSYRLHVAATAPTNNIIAYLVNSQGGSTRARIGMQDASTTFAPDFGAVGDNITIDTVGAERMRIDSSGNVGIGTTTTTLSGNVFKSAISAGTLSLVGLNNTGNTNKAWGFLIGDSGAGTAGRFHIAQVVDGSTSGFGGGPLVPIISADPPTTANTTPRLLISADGTVSDQNGALRNIPSAGAAKTSAYTLSISDIGEFVTVGSGGSITVPNDVFAAGNAVSIYNDTTGNISINCPITTAYLAGTNTDRASLTLATRGIATVLFINPSLCVASGNLT